MKSADGTLRSRLVTIATRQRRHSMQPSGANAAGEGEYKAPTAGDMLESGGCNATVSRAVLPHCCWGGLVQGADCTSRRY